VLSGSAQLSINFQENTMTTIHIEDNGVTAALNQLSRQLSPAGMQPVFNEIGLQIHSLVVDCFKEEKSPDGINWAVLSPTTLKKRGANAKKLRDKGNMFASLGHNATGDHVDITIGQDYAPFHQFGTENMSARPFFPTEILPQNWETEILEIINNYLQN
jgi:phage virion morphogenesis protein